MLGQCQLPALMGAGDPLHSLSVGISIPVCLCSSSLGCVRVPSQTGMLTGNKSNLEHRQAMSPQEGEQFARVNGLMFVESNAKAAHDVEKVRQYFHRRSLGGGSRLLAACGVRRTLHRALEEGTLGWLMHSCGRFFPGLYQHSCTRCCGA